MSGDPLYFLHLAKTAGTTVYSILDLQYDSREIFPANGWAPLESMGTTDLSQYRLFRGHYGYDFYQALESRPATITMLRDPFATSLSVFDHRKRDPELTFCPGKNLVQYVREDPEEACTVLASIYHRQLIPRSHWDAPATERVELAIRNLEEFEFVGISERFDESMLLLCSTFGWNPVTQTQALNVSPRVKTDPGLPDDVERLLREFNRENDRIYQHGCQLFQERLLSSYREFVRDQHRKKRSTEPAQGQVCLSFDQKLCGTGWHRYEDLAGLAVAPFRWTGPGVESTLDFRLKTDRDLSLSLYLINYITESVLDSLALRVNDTIIPLLREQRQGFTVLRGMIPKTVLESDTELTRLVLRTSETRSPHSLDPSNPDDRQLGIAVSKLEISPAD